MVEEIRVRRQDDADQLVDLTGRNGTGIVDLLAQIVEQEYRFPFLNRIFAQGENPAVGERAGDRDVEGDPVAEGILHLEENLPRIHLRIAGELGRPVAPLVGHHFRAVEAIRSDHAGDSLFKGNKVRAFGNKAGIELVRLGVLGRRRANFI